RLYRFARKALDQVGEVELLRRAAGDVQLWMLQTQLIEDRRHAKQRRPRGIDDGLVDIDERRLAVALADMQPVQYQFQRERIEVHLAYADGAIEHGAQAALQLALDQRRCGEEAEQAEDQQQHAEDQRAFAYPMGVVHGAGTFTPRGDQFTVRRTAVCHAIAAPWTSRTVGARLDRPGTPISAAHAGLPVRQCSAAAIGGT